VDGLRERGYSRTVLRVPEDQLFVFIREARKSFKEYFGGGGVQ